MTKLTVILSAILFLVWMYLTLTRPLGVTILQAEQVQNFSPAFPVSRGIYQSWFRLFGTGETQLRLMGGLLLAFTGLALVSALSRRIPARYLWLLLLTVFTLPGLYVLSLNHLPELLSLFFLAGYFRFMSAGWLVPLALTSGPGFLAGLVLAVIRIKRVDYMAILVLLALVIWALIRHPLSGSDFILRLNYERLQADVAAEQQTFYLARTRQPIPALVRRLAFSPALTGLQRMTQKFAEIIDPTLWTAPLSAWVVTGLSGVPPKGVWPVAYYWQIPFMVAGSLSGLFLPALLAGAAPLLYYDPAAINSASALLLPGLILLAVRGVLRVSVRIRAAPIIFAALAVAGFASFTYHTFVKTSDIQRTDLLAFRYLSDQYGKLTPRYSRFVITDRHGPTGLMLDFYQNRRPENVEVRAFLPADRGSAPDTVYMGFAREFTADGREPETGVIDRIRLSDELVYGFGRDIWIVAD